MAKAKDLAGLAALGALGYMLNKKSYNEDAGKQETSSYTGDTKKVEAKDVNYGNEGRRTSMGVAPAPKTTTKAAPKLETITTRKDPREAEAGMSRGTRTTSMAGAGRGSVNPPIPKPADPRSAEAGMSRGTRNMTPSPGQADIDKVRRIQETFRVPSSMAGRPGYDETGRPMPSMAGRPGYDEAGNRMKHGGAVKMASGGMTASRRADGIATKGKTRGKIC